MAQTIEISVHNRVAWQTNSMDYICGNGDFVVKFLFDSEWSEHKNKTARFIYNGEHEDVVFDGTECSVPKILGVKRMEVGVYAGDLYTTTPALVHCRKSILCDSGLPADPTPDVYAQIMEMLDEAGDVMTVNGIEPDENGNVEIDTGVNVQSANVGQMIVVKTVDENGKPIEWEAVDLPEDEVFIAEYDVSTYEEVKAAIESGKYVFAKRNTNYYPLSSDGSVAILFSRCLAGYEGNLSLMKTGWGNGTVIQYLNQSDITANVTDDAKKVVTSAAVFNYAQPKGNYLTEVPDGYAKTDDIPTDNDIIELIETHTDSADWNAKEGESGFVKNRTHWVSCNKVIVEQQTVVADSWEGIAEVALSEYLEKGKEYRVIFEGKEYTCVANTTFDSLYLGNVCVSSDCEMGFADGTAFNTGEPFCIIAIDNYGYLYVAKGGEYTLSVAEVEYHKLPSEYLDMDAIKEAITGGGSGIDVESAAVGQTIIVKAVDENGKPTQWEAAEYPLIAVPEVIFPDTLFEEVDIDIGDYYVSTLPYGIYFYTSSSLRDGETYTITVDGRKYVATAERYENIHFFPEGEEGYYGIRIVTDDFRIYYTDEVDGVEYTGYSAMYRPENPEVDDWEGLWLYEPMTIGIYKEGEKEILDPKYMDMDGIKAAFPTVEMVATLEDGTTAVYKLYGEKVTA